MPARQFQMGEPRAFIAGLCRRNALRMRSTAVKLRAVLPAFRRHPFGPFRNYPEQIPRCVTFVNVTLAGQ